eukprot:15330131-Ditylum_brightwellii.AAC.1
MSAVGVWASPGCSLWNRHPWRCYLLQPQMWYFLHPQNCYFGEVVVALLSGIFQRGNLVLLVVAFASIYALCEMFLDNLFIHPGQVVKWPHHVAFFHADGVGLKQAACKTSMMG